MRAIASRAAALEARGASAEAIELWAGLVERAPASVAARIGLANAQIRAARPADALPHLEAAVSVAAAHPAGWLALGIARAMLGQHAPARLACERAVALAGGVAATHCGLGDVLYLSGDGSGAERAYERALAIAPADADTLNKLAVIARAGRRRDAAEALLARALACAPDHPYARVNLATLALERNRPDDGRRGLEVALALPGLPADARGVAADALAMLNEREAMAGPVAAALAADDPAPIDAVLHGRQRPDEVDARAVDDFAALVERTRMQPPLDDRFAPGCPRSAVWPAIEAHCCYCFDGDAEALARSVRVVAGAEAPATPRDADVLQYARVVADDARNRRACPAGLGQDAWLRWTHARLLGHRPEFFPGTIRLTSATPGGARAYAATSPRLAAGTLRAMLALLADGLPPGGWRATLTILAILRIHPFCNGNKRLARYAANCDLAAAGLMPIVNVAGADRALMRLAGSAWMTRDARELAALFATATWQAETLDAARAGGETA